MGSESEGSISEGRVRLWWAKRRLAVELAARLSAVRSASSGDVWATCAQLEAYVNRAPLGWHVFLPEDRLVLGELLERTSAVAFEIGEGRLGASLSRLATELSGRVMLSEVSVGETESEINALRTQLQGLRHALKAWHRLTEPGPPEYRVPRPQVGSND